MAEKEETVLLEDSGIKVTNLRVVIQSKTYALSNITSVEMSRQEPSGCVPTALILLGGAVAACSILLLVSSLLGVSSAKWQWSTGLFVTFLVFGGLATGFAGFYFMRSAKPDFSVKIGSASGESNILESKDQAMIGRIVTAINEAIVRKG